MPYKNQKRAKETRPQFNIRFPTEMMKEVMRVLKKVNKGISIGRASKADLIREAIRRGLRLIEAEVDTGSFETELKRSK